MYHPHGNLPPSVHITAISLLRRHNFYFRVKSQNKPSAAKGANYLTLSQVYFDPNEVDKNHIMRLHPLSMLRLLYLIERCYFQLCWLKNTD